MADRKFHRYGGELLALHELYSTPDRAKRVALALGTAPVPDARHLLPPLSLPPPRPALPDGPYTPSDFVLDITGRFPVPVETVKAAFAPERRAGWGFGVCWVQSQSPQGVWFRLEEYRGGGRVTACAISWELTGLLMTGAEAMGELAGYVLRVQECAVPFGLQVAPREDPVEAVHRATQLSELRQRFGYSVELRLMPQGRSFPARTVWQTAYSLGFIWGDMDLFHWHDSVSGQRLFSLSTVGHPGYFLPERAAEGEGTQGIALSFALPHNPDPLATYDRMGIALAHFRKQLGGFPRTPTGLELDADQLWSDRDLLAIAVQEMSRAGLPPGSPEALKVF